MFNIHQIPLDGDPSNRQQTFEKMHIDILCCRYWWLRAWQSQLMSFPYWRLYWNRTEGAYVVYKKKIRLTPGSIVLIPPHTSFSTGIEGKQTAREVPYALQGGWVEDAAMEELAVQRGDILHLFIHFRLGFPFDSVEAGIYEIQASSENQRLIQNIICQLIDGAYSFDPSQSLQVYSLILSAAGFLPADIWKDQMIDRRILKGIDLMEQNIHKTRIESQDLASLAGMANNSYIRLFREQTGYSPKKYLQRMRVEQACTLLHHSGLSIKEIAALCGFSDRYYFTKIFTRVMKMSPGAYRRNSLAPSPKGFQLR